MKPKFASLHGGLLARKGEASPAIPSPLSHVVYVDEPPSHSTVPEVSARRDVAGRTSAPQDGHKPMLRPHTANDGSDRVLPRAALDADALEAPAPEVAPVTRSAPVPVPAARDRRSCKASVRLTAEQKRRLGIVAAQMDLPHSRILARALDAYLDEISRGAMTGCACLRSQGCKP